MTPCKLLFGTANPAKLSQMRAMLQHLAIEVVGLSDLGITKVAEERGKDPESNARIKACTYFSESGMPTFAVDSGLWVERFSPDVQPGVHVRRICASDREATDEDMIDFYTRELEKVGGESRATWQTAVAMTLSKDRTDSATYTSETVLTCELSPVIVDGEPLRSFQKDPDIGKYYSEMTSEELVKAHGARATGVIQFIEAHISEL